MRKIIAKPTSMLWKHRSGATSIGKRISIFCRDPNTFIEPLIEWYYYWIQMYQFWPKSMVKNRVIKLNLSENHTN